MNAEALRTAMRQSAMPGEDPETLRTPDELAPRVLRLLAADSQDTGQLYDFQSDTIIRYPA